MNHQDSKLRNHTTCHNYRRLLLFRDELQSLLDVIVAYLLLVGLNVGYFLLFQVSRCFGHQRTKGSLDN